MELILETKVESNGSQRVILKLTGNIDESSSYPEIEERQLSNIDTLEFDVEGIGLINSSGIQKWLAYVNQLTKEPRRIEISKCPVRMVNQINMFPFFFGKRNFYLISFFAPFFCEKCDQSRHSLMVADPLMIEGIKQNKITTEVVCDHCRCKMEFDGIIKKYFSFVKYENISLYD